MSTEVRTDAFILKTRERRRAALGAPMGRILPAAILEITTL
jgi:hypothetical protein